MRDFLSGPLFGVFLTNTWDGTPNDWRSSLTPGRNGKTSGDLFGVMIKDVLLSLFKYSALVNETLPLQSPFCWLGQSLPHRVVLQPLEFGSLAKQFKILLSLTELKSHLFELYFVG